MNRKLSLMLAATLIASTLTLPASAVGKHFSDVPDNHWASESISYAAGKGYFSGTSFTTFAPDGTMTRAMLWTVLSRMDNATNTAAPGQPWYQSGLNWAVSNGISDGTNPNGNITREQFATMLRNFAKHTGADTAVDAAVLSRFADRGSIASYAVDSMAWAVTHGIVSGTTNSTISPSGLATRSQAAMMLMRFDQMGESKPPVANYKTVFAAIDVPPYTGDTTEVGDMAYVSIASTPYGANVKAGVTYTVTASDPSVVSVSKIMLSPDEVNYSVKGLKAGTVTLTAVGSDGYRGTVNITVRGAAEQEKPALDTGAYAKLKAEVVKLINQERSRLGLHILATSEKIMQAAQIRASECATWKFSHTRPNGTSFNTVFMDVAVPSGGGEILGSGYTTAKTVVDAWINSPGHHKTMTQDNYNYIGVGVARGHDGLLYYSVIFCPIGE